ncbi:MULTISPECIES: dihydroxy-acid dehydratase [unclassified Paenibacillus]|uniref:dihydroxy-acid dehydratase domain-containing protein n=1 Tax=unclassified Paenibacillus TaxID=185978 RepID=UPI001B4BEDBA|nr:MULTISPECIES: dihydroxy-acid dehydratase [unclassified Paenibacillus]MBP1155835.1 dihydroxyacid dehydratase/phosphogluconate dehydratase [Paenibacillus sp. PvP091]MBP1168779.1 dihydroxyacid dehydratase/phosphogluconate dehydratase [Paenibacillus sp. PvR098]MBP2439807.1 dihydroxyacid dehydratase/phosphogluconate dehydratase [Paenibacillus sp. PvP052]
MKTIHHGVNPYQGNVQGKANEPITVAGLLDRARRSLGGKYEGGEPDWTLDNIYDRLENNSPRIAIIGGSSDHPAHILDHETVYKAALKIWQEGGVPFYFSTPVLCDGTAQNNMGMSYSLQSRNAIAEIVVNQMEAQSYHGAFVIQGCDKQPLGVLSALAHLDRVRRYRGEHHVFATFAPSHVLKGGTIPDDLKLELAGLVSQAVAAGYDDIAADIEDAVSYILQCSSNTSFQGVFERAVECGLLTEERHKYFEKRLAVSTCDSKGGICAFHGTGNSSRDVTTGFGIVSPELELLTDPPTQAQVNQAIESLFSIIDRPECSVSELVRANITNVIRIHSSAGGSTNLMMHIVGAMVYAGYDFSLEDMERIAAEHPIPDLFDYSLTEGRDIYVLAQQCCSGQIRGMETLMYELTRNGVPMALDAPTVTGQTWGERLSNTVGLSADGVKNNPIILSKPKRSFSGVDVLRGNFFNQAVVKISGMPTKQLNQFDDKVAFVLYYENEEEANHHLLDVNMLDRLKAERHFELEHMKRMASYNASVSLEELQTLSYDELFDRMIREEWLRLAVIISGQGPEAFGMPEMMTPMQHINAHRQLKCLTTLISDGRYSGVTFGAAVGHMTPEAFHGGGLLYLQEGDLLHLQFRKKRIDLLNPQSFALGLIEHDVGELRNKRTELGIFRMEKMRKRQKRVAASNRLRDCTDASRGVVPMGVALDAELKWI